MAHALSTEEFAKGLSLEIVYAGRGTIEVETSDVNRPGLQFTGYFQNFAYDRVQLLGTAEIQYLDDMEPNARAINLDKFMQYTLPCVICARDLYPPEDLLNAAKKYFIPVLKGLDATSKLEHSIINYLDTKLAPTVTQHGVLVDVHGVGMLLMGESGLGKSETALELVKRGHRLIADDVVIITRIASDKLSGTAPELTRHLLEIRGIGLIDVRHMYGIGSILMNKEINIILYLETWKEGKAYERMGLDDEYETILGVKIPRLTIPVRPGRNLAVVAEAAARNHRLKWMGYDAAKEFEKRLQQQMDELNKENDYV